MDVFDQIMLSILIAFTYVLLTIYVTRWVYIFTGLQKLDLEEGAEPVRLKDLK